MGAVGTSDEDVVEVGGAVRDCPLGPRRSRMIVEHGHCSGGDQPGDQADGNDSRPHRPFRRLPEFLWFV
jgi:hypothetical protein